MILILLRLLFPPVSLAEESGEITTKKIPENQTSALSLVHPNNSLQKQHYNNRENT